MSNNFDFITVVGVGSRRNGVSKSGNAYDFFPVHIIYAPAPGDKINGKGAAEILVDTDTMNRIHLAPGDDFTVCLNKARSGVTVTHWVGRGHVDLDLL